MSVLLAGAAVASAEEAVPTPADVYGELFEQVQLNAVFPDSKAFVDALPNRPPEQILNDVNTGMTNVSRNRTQACNGVAQLERQRRQAEAGGGGANPFAPNAGRRPQLDLRTPGAL